MERVNLFKTSKWLSQFLQIFGAFATVIGVFLIGKSIKYGFDTRFFEGNWNGVFFTIQGILFIITGYFSHRNSKYFIEWTDDEIRLLLPDTKGIEVIKRADVLSVTTRLFTIELHLAETVRTINLDGMDFEDIKKLKHEFE